MSVSYSDLEPGLFVLQATPPLTASGVGQLTLVHFPLLLWNMNLNVLYYNNADHSMTSDLGEEAAESRELTSVL